MRTLIKLFILPALMANCSHGRLEITSSHPARIEIQGRQVCASTPCKTNAWNYTDPLFGCAPSLPPYNNKIEAFPLNNERKLASQYKEVRVKCDEVVPVFFDMTNKNGTQINNKINNSININNNN